MKDRPFIQRCLPAQRVRVNRFKLRTLLFMLAVLCVSCKPQRDPGSDGVDVNRPKTNAVSVFSEDGRLTGKITYSSDGSVKHRIFFQTTEDGRILSSRTVDSQGHLKWLDQHEFVEGGGNRPVQTRRTQPDGTTVLIRYRYDQDGTATRTVLGSDGREVTQNAHQEYFED